MRDKNFYKRLSQLGLKKRWEKEHSKYTLNPNWTKEKAGISAYLCGDGYITIRKDRNKVIHHEALVILDNFELCKYVVKLFEKEFNITLNVFPRKDHCFAVRLNNKPITLHLLSLGDYRSENWNIPPNLNEEQLKEWIKCFFDCEACVDELRKKIQVKSINHEGLNQIKKILENLKINSNLYGPYKQQNKKHKDYSILVVPPKSILEYKRLISFNHPLKKEKLAHMAQW